MKSLDAQHLRAVDIDITIGLLQIGESTSSNLSCWRLVWRAMEMTQPNAQCSLLLFVATPSEEEALEEAALSRGIPFVRVRDTKLGEYHWLGVVGNETVIAVRPVREDGRLVMGSLGRLGSAARAIRFREATGAQAIVQLGMAFGIDRERQNHGDVLVSASLIPYDNRVVIPASNDREGCVVDYSRASLHPARPKLVDLFLCEQGRDNRSFTVYVGTMLSGAARIHCRCFRDELVAGVSGGEAPIVGGEMEGAGLLAASTGSDDPVWCIVKGISDFADECRDNEIKRFRSIACRNAADLVLSALVNDVRRK